MLLSSVVLLHGDMDQFERNKVINAFKKQEIPVLVATDVAGQKIWSLTSKHALSWISQNSHALSDFTILLHALQHFNSRQSVQFTAQTTVALKAAVNCQEVRKLKKQFNGGSFWVAIGGSFWPFCLFRFYQESVIKFGSGLKAIFVCVLNFRDLMSRKIEVSAYVYEVRLNQFNVFWLCIQRSNHTYHVYFLFSAWLGHPVNQNCHKLWCGTWHSHSHSPDWSNWQSG